MADPINVSRGGMGMAETTPSDAQDFVTAQVDLQVAGTRVQFALTVPTAPVPPGAILPVFQTLSEAIQADVASGLEEEGKRISCRAGCGACCRQLVPITKIEARYLAELVDSMPEPRQSEIRSRFAEVIRRLEEAGILETLRHPEWVLPETKEKLGLTYFGLGIPCPFLENESCSIHENRPLVCREYLVTSPPEHCANPAGKLVEGVKLLVGMSGFLARFAESAPPGPGSGVVLPLALEWAASHPDESPARPGPEWVERLFRMVAGESALGSGRRAEGSEQ
ncbi:MAG: YkgJ family cysteine cluster protein [Isosphaeraceae bacterium]